MKNIKKGVATLIALDQANLPQGKTITLTIIGEYGNVLKDKDNALIQDLPLSYNSTTFKYESRVFISDEETEQYIRLYFNGNDVSIDEAYQPEDARLISLSPVALAELVPTQYFIDYVLAASAKMDEAFKASSEEFIRTNRNAIQSYLQSAQGDLERATKLYFTERTVTDKRDYYFNNFPANLWLTTVFNPPINELVSFELFYGNTKIAEISKALLVINREMGTVEFLPAPGGDSAGLYSLLLSNVNGLALALLGPSTVERVPGMFVLSYKTGLIYQGSDPYEKESIRHAVARRTLSKLLPIIDPGARTPSRTEGIDGVSTTLSYSVDKMFQKLKEEEETFINDLMMKYGRGVEAIVV
ncbi:MAG: hypothetical protein ACM34K_05765 [Bacillota bacterium]